MATRKSRGRITVMVRIEKNENIDTRLSGKKACCWAALPPRGVLSVVVRFFVVFFYLRQCWIHSSRGLLATTVASIFRSSKASFHSTQTCEAYPEIVFIQCDKNETKWQNVTCAEKQNKTRNSSRTERAVFSAAAAK